MSKEFDINNVNEEGVTSKEMFTEEEKATQLQDPADDPIFAIHEDEKSAGKKLTDKQRMFARYYVATGELARAAHLAGYGKGYGKPLRTVAQALRMNPDINAYVAELMEKKLEQQGYSKDQLARTLAIIANHRMSDFLDITKETKISKDGNEYTKTNIELKDLYDIDREPAVDEYGFPLKDEDGNPIYVDSGKSLAIKSINYTDSGKVRVEYYDRMQAIEKMTKMMGIDGKQQIEINSNLKVERTEKSLLDKLMKKFGNEPEVEIPAEENEWYKEQQRAKELAEQEKNINNTQEGGDING